MVQVENKTSKTNDEFYATATVKQATCKNVVVLQEKKNDRDT